MAEQNEAKPLRLRKDGTAWGKKTEHEPTSLTERGIQAKKPPKTGQLVQFDTGQKGLVFKVGHGGGKSFSVVYYPEGRPKYFKLGNYHPDGVGDEDYPDPTKTLERPKDLKLAGARRAALLFRSNPQAFLNPKAPSVISTFKVVAERFLAEEAVDYISKPELERCLRKYVFPKLGDVPVAAIRRGDVMELRTDIVAGIRATKRNSAIPITGERQADAATGIIRSVLLWWEDASKDDYVCPLKPKRKTRRRAGSQRVAGKRRKGRTRILAADEIKLIWKAAGQLGLYGSMVKLLLLSGQRREKVSSARWRDFQDNVWTIAVEHEFEKGNGGMLKLPPFAMSVLSAIPKVDGCSFVFPGRYAGRVPQPRSGRNHTLSDKPFNSFSQGAADLRKLLPANMARWTLHDLRRTARSIMTDLRVDDRTAEMVLGHAIEGVEETYNLSEYSEQKFEALAKLAGYVQNLVEPESEKAGRKPRNSKATVAPTR